LSLDHKMGKSTLGVRPKVSALSEASLDCAEVATNVVHAEPVLTEVIMGCEGGCCTAGSASQHYSGWATHAVVNSS